FSKQDISTLLGIGHFYFALTGVKSGVKSAWSAGAAGVGDTGTVEVQLVADNLRESFRAIASSPTGGELRRLHGVSIASAGVTFQMFNTAFLSGPVNNEAELKQRILQPIVHFDSRGQEWAYWVCEDWIDPLARKRARRLFENHGLRLSTELPGMIAD